jgi:hypothetical protein
VGFELRIVAFEPAKTVHAIDRAVTVIGIRPTSSAFKINEVTETTIILHIFRHISLVEIIQLISDVAM